MRHNFKFTVTVSCEDPRTAAIIRDEIADRVQDVQDSTEAPARIEVGDISRPDRTKGRKTK